MKDVVIIGAGMAGLLAGAIMRQRVSRIVEKKKQLPNNHNALLRFRSKKVSEALNIPFKEVLMDKAVLTTGNPMRDKLQYSKKCTGKYTNNRSIKEEFGATRYIAPADFITQMANCVKGKIQYGVDVDRDFITENNKENIIISTMPMAFLMDILYPDQYPDFGKDSIFNFVPGYTCSMELKSSEAYTTLYIPEIGENKLYNRQGGRRN